MNKFFPTEQFKSVNSAKLSVRPTQSLHVKASDNPYFSVSVSLSAYFRRICCIPIYTTDKVEILQRKYETNSYLPVYAL